MSRTTTWIKGPRCGVDNCSSRLYRSADGRRVCRNGHVKEGDIEIAYDDGEYDAGTQVRSLHLPSQRASQIALATVATRKRESMQGSLGKEAEAVFMQVLQYILRLQVEWLLEKQGFPSNYESVVRSLWLMYANLTPLSEKKFPNVEDWVKMTDFHDSKRGEDGVEANSTESTENTKTKANANAKTIPKKSAYDVKRPVSLDTVSICILACAVLKLPVSSYDFYRWIYQSDFPYLKGKSLLPDEMRKEIPGMFQRSFAARKRPDMSNVMYLGVLKIAKILYAHYNFTVPEINWKPLLFKYTRDMFLPLEVYLAASKIIETLGLRFDLTLTKVVTRSNPEVKLLCILIIAAKLCFGFDGKARTFKSIRKPTYTMDWSLYFDMLRKIWIEVECFADMDDRSVMFWNTPKIERFVAWCEQNAKDDREDLQFTMKRLKDFFPIGKYDEAGEPMRQAAYINEEKLLTPTIDTVFEIIRVLQSTATWTEEPNNSSFEKDPLEPGDEYISNGVPPVDMPLLDNLYKSAASLCGVKESYFVAILRQMESDMKDLQNILDFDETLDTVMLYRRPDILPAVLNAMPKEEHEAVQRRIKERKKTLARSGSLK